MLTISKLGMGLGGPIGGFISDRFALSCHPVCDTDLRIRVGWRWAFLMQMPLFIISLLLTGANLNYSTPVRPFVLTALLHAEAVQLGKGQKHKGRTKAN